MPQETRLVEVKRQAALAFARANGIDRRIHGQAGAGIGIAAAGKTWLDVAHALELLGIDESGARALGITTRKIGQVFPLETEGLAEWARGLSLLLVVEEKRKIIEGQVKEALYGRTGAPRVWGWRDGEGRELFYALSQETVYYRFMSRAKRIPRRPRRTPVSCRRGTASCR